MKRIIFAFIAVTTMTILFSACSSGHECPAYGQAESQAQVENA